ncbi:MAG: fumarylacetoacetate hydrolase family protein [Solirubrobacteraceae bacterium]
MSLALRPRHGDHSRWSAVGALDVQRRGEDDHPLASCKPLEPLLRFSVLVSSPRRPPDSSGEPAEPLDYVAGLTILNDFSARDIQAREMASGLGPSKGKHFACSAGPWIATLDVLPRSGLRMQARVNGETWCDATSADMIWSIAEVVVLASQSGITK